MVTPSGANQTAAGARAHAPGTLCYEHGITAIAQPGGSVKDKEAIAAADKAGVAMVFTIVRHFRH